MSLTTYIQSSRTQVSFKSAWVHLVVQIASAYLLLSDDITFLFIFITQFPGILYFAFQFPITGLLIRITQDIVHEKFPPEQVLQKFLVSALLFALFGCGIALVILLTGSFVNLDDKGALAPAILENFKIVFVYFAPVLFSGELIRQRLYFKKVYGQNR